MLEERRGQARSMFRLDYMIRSTGQLWSNRQNVIKVFNWGMENNLYIPRKCQLRYRFWYFKVQFNLLKFISIAAFHHIQSNNRNPGRLHSVGTVQVFHDLLVSTDSSVCPWLLNTTQTALPSYVITIITFNIAMCTHTDIHSFTETYMDNMPRGPTTTAFSLFHLVLS